MPSSEQAREARRLSLSLPWSSFAPRRIFLALRIAVISAVWPLLLLAMSCMPPSPRDECESGHCGCCKPLRLLSRAASLLLRLSVLLSVRLPAPAIHHHPSMWCCVRVGWLGWAEAIKVIHIHLHTLTTATALQQSPAGACLHAPSRPVLLPATR